MSNFIYKKPRSKTLKKEIEIINKHKAHSKNKIVKTQFNPDEARLDLGLIDTKLFQDTSIV